MPKLFETDAFDGFDDDDKEFFGIGKNSPFDKHNVLWVGFKP
jgi:hypothetical protein